MKRANIAVARKLAVLLHHLWTGFADSEEQYADEFVGQRLQPFWIEDEAKGIANTNFCVAERFEARAVRDGNLITGQQQYSATAVARLVIEALSGDAKDTAAAASKAS